jgi:hypothetical protein
MEMSDFIPQQLYLAKEPRNPLNRRLAGLQNGLDILEKEDFFCYLSYPGTSSPIG